MEIGPDNKPTIFEYIKRSARILLEIEFMINRKIIGKLKQLITIEKFFEVVQKIKCSHVTPQSCLQIVLPYH